MIDKRQRSKYNQRISPRDAINSIHKIIGIDNPCTCDQSHNYSPPGKSKQLPLIEHQAHRRKMKNKTKSLWYGADIIYKADHRHQSESQHKPRVLKLICQKISQCTQVEDNSSTPQCNPGMRTPFIRFVDNIIFIGNMKIKKFCQK